MHAARLLKHQHQHLYSHAHPAHWLLLRPLLMLRPQYMMR